jgi:hypothetical protein
MWDRCWSTAVVRLGLTPAQFFRLTPRQLRVLADKDWERIEQEREHAEMIGGIIAAAIANYAGRISKVQKSALDFMPSHVRRQANPPRVLIAQNIRCFLQAQTELRNKCQK